MILSKEDLRALACDIQNDYKSNGQFPKKKMEQLWNAVLPFIEMASYKKSLKAGPQVKKDLMQVSYEALCSAIRNYDSSKMDNFFIYVKGWISAYMKTESTKNISLFRFGSRNDRHLFNKIESVKGLSVEEQTKILGVSEFEIAAFSQATKIPKSLLKKKADDNSDSDVEEYLKADMPDPLKLYELKCLFEKIKDVFDHFVETEIKTDKERDILDLLRRVGATEKGNFKKKEENDNSEPQDYQDIADKYGISREAVRQNANKIKDKLRYRFEKNGIDSKAYHTFI